MLEELNSLLKNQTWLLIPHLPSINVVGCKWVYKVKQKSKGTLERYKVRLVAWGFHQQLGKDYGDIFSPIV